MSQTTTLQVLQCIYEAHEPVGATYLSARLPQSSATLGRTLAALEAEGLLVKVSNKGRTLTDKGRAYIQTERREVTETTAAKTLVHHLAVTDEQTMLEILDARKLLEEYTVVRACLYGTAEEMATLQQLLREHTYAMHTRNYGSDVDLRLHLFIAKMARNLTVVRLLRLMLVPHKEYHHFSYISEALENRHVKQHDAIVTAIAKRDATAAKLAIDDHFRQVRRDVIDYFKQHPNTP